MAEYRVNVENLNEIDKKLRRISFPAKMDFITSISAQLDPFSIADETKRVSRIYPYGMKQAFELAYIALRGIVVGEWRGNLLDNIFEKDFFPIANLFRGYKPPINESGIFVEKFLIWTAHQQFKFQVSEIYSLDRYKSLLEFSDNNHNVKIKFIDVFKFDYFIYIQFIVACNLIFSKYAFITVDKFIEETKKAFSLEQIIFMLDILAVTREKFVFEYERTRSNIIEMQVYDFNPLEMYPIIKENNTLFCPIPFLLNKAITQGFFHRLCDKYGMEFKEEFGNIFEEYVYWLLKSIEKDKKIKVIKEFKYIKNGSEARSPDFILYNKDSMIFIEIKSNSPILKFRHTDDEVYERQIMQSYGEGLVQCIKKETDFKEGIMQHPEIDDSKIKNIHYLLITFEEFYISKSLKVLQIIDRNTKDFDVIKSIENKKIIFMSLKGLDDFFEYDSRSFMKFLEEEGSNLEFIFGESNIRYKKRGSEAKYKVLMDKAFKTLHDKINSK